jgi:hypothetical protein
MLPATITKIHQAFKEIQHMQCDALKDILEYRLDNAVDAHLEQKRTQGLPDRRNGRYPRHLLTELGDLLLRIPRTRTFSARVLLKRFARRAFLIERLILLSFLFGLSTRKVGQALPPSWANASAMLISIGPHNPCLLYRIKNSKTVVLIAVVVDKEHIKETQLLKEASASYRTADTVLGLEVNEPAQTPVETLIPQ